MKGNRQGSLSRWIKQLFETSKSFKKFSSLSKKFFRQAEGRTQRVRPSLAFCNYLPSCLAISSAKFGPARLTPSGDPGFYFCRGEVNPPRRKVLPPAKRLHALARDPPPGGRRRTPKHGKGPDTLCPALGNFLLFTCPAAWQSPRRSSPASSRCPRPSRSGRRP